MPAAALRGARRGAERKRKGRAPGFGSVCRALPDGSGVRSVRGAVQEARCRQRRRCGTLKADDDAPSGAATLHGAHNRADTCHGEARGAHVCRTRRNTVKELVSYGTKRGRYIFRRASVACSVAWQSARADALRCERVSGRLARDTSQWQLPQCVRTAASGRRDTRLAPSAAPTSASALPAGGARRVRAARPALTRPLPHGRQPGSSAGDANNVRTGRPRGARSGGAYPSNALARAARHAAARAGSRRFCPIIALLNSPSRRVWPRLTRRGRSKRRLPRRE